MREQQEIVARQARQVSAPLEQRELLGQLALAELLALMAWMEHKARLARWREFPTSSRRLRRMQIREMDSCVCRMRLRMHRL